MSFSPLVKEDVLYRLKLQNVKKIAVLRAGALGDFIVTLPAFDALRATYPSAEIILLGKPWQKEFLVKGRTSVDRVIVIPVKKGIRVEADHTNENEDEIERFFENMRHEALDVVLNFQGNGASANPFIKRLSARLTAGPVPPAAETDQPDRFYEFYYYQHEAIRYLDTAALIGARVTTLEPIVHVLEQDREEAKDLLHRLQYKPFVVLHPVAMDMRRMWPLENYPALINELVQRNVEVVFTGAASDKTIVDDVIAESKASVINTCGELSLGGLTALLSKAAVVIAVDTGPLHLARAVNAPTVGIHWAPNLINWGPLTRVIHKPVVSWNLTCPLCGIIPNDPYPFEPRTECNHEVSFVRDITVGQVLQATDSLLQMQNVKRLKQNA
jgi:ADP-heptose:LPS heptosyltransferase